MQVQRQIDKLLAQRAAEWLETLESGGSRERRKFAAWLRQSKLHVEHYLEAVAIDREIAALDRAQSPDIDALLARAAPHIETLRTAPFAAASALDARPARYWKLSAALAAGFAVLVLTAFHVELGLPWQADRVTTIAGEQRSLTLEDGSVIALNTNTDLRIQFSDRERGLQLNTGEAVFKVAHDASRPFIVRTATAEVRAIGTQFNVYQRVDGTVVSVIEGRVQVTPLASPQQPALTVARAQNITAGEEALVAAASGDIQRHAQPDVQKVLAWRQRRLNFDETSLEDIVREFNRYGPTERLRLEGIAPGTRRYGGVFDADDPESFVALLEREQGLKVQRRNGEIVISQR